MTVGMGLRLTTSRNGQRESEKNYKHGIMDGLWSFWYPNGQKKSEELWRNGDHYGIWRQWNEKGELISIARWARESRSEPIPEPDVELDELTKILRQGQRGR